MQHGTLFGRTACHASLVHPFARLMGYPEFSRTRFPASSTTLSDDKSRTVATPTARSRLKALHVLAPMREGGLERVVAMLAHGQTSTGVHVAAVLEPHDAAQHPFVRRLEELEVPVTVIAVDPRNYWGEYKALRALITRLRPDVVHTHGYRADIVAGFAARRSGIPQISTVHGFTGGGIRNRAYERVQRFALRRADAVIAVAAAMIDRLAAAGIPRDRIHCVPNGFIDSSPALERHAARATLGLSFHQPIIGWVGRLSREKGADVMLEALALADPAWRLSVIGDGPEMGKLKANAQRLGIAERVIWHGAVADAASLLRAYDVVALSSRTEGTPIVLFEAMNAEVPIVATAVGGVPDVISAEQGLLVPPETPALLAEALDRVRVDPDAASQRSRLARQRLAEKFGHSAWVQSVDRAYEIARRSRT